MNADNYKHSESMQKIIGAFYKVGNTLGYGFLESERNQNVNAKYFQTKKILFNHNNQRHQRSKLAGE
jgi:hypothetical protein